MLFVGNKSRMLLAVVLSSLSLLVLAGQQQDTDPPSLSPATGTSSPSAFQSNEVTIAPTGASVTTVPTNLVTAEPTSSPTVAPTTLAPTTAPSAAPTTVAPTTGTTEAPTVSPTTEASSPQLENSNGPAGPTWGGCVDPRSGDGGIVKIGDRTTICLTIGPRGDWGQGAKYLRWVFQPKADQYSRFHIPNSYDDLVNSEKLGAGLTVHAASQDFLSFLRIYWDPDHLDPDQRVFPFLTAIVDVEDGIVRGVAWDDACKFCEKGRCLENTYNFAGVASTNYDPPLNENTKGCYLKRSECKDAKENKGGYAANKANVCDLNLYVVWTGTDRDGDAFQSSSSRFGAFPAAQLEDRISQNLPDVF